MNSKHLFATVSNVSSADILTFNSKQIFSRNNVEEERIPSSQAACLVDSLQSDAFSRGKEKHNDHLLETSLMKIVNNSTD